MDAELLERLGGGGSDGGNAGACAEGIEGCIFEAFLAGNPGQVNDLRAGGEESEVEVAGGEAANGLTQGGGVFGEGVFVDADGGDLGVEGAESGDEVGIGAAVLLESDIAERPIF